MTRSQETAGAVSSEETSGMLANNPLNLCPHGLYEGSGDCDECRAEYEASEAAYAEKLDADEAAIAYLYADEPFWEFAL